jgi:GWxTD domain-containing protein
MILLFLIMLQVLEVNVYRFENGYVEIWYGLPISALVDSMVLERTEDSTHVTYSYGVSIRNADGTDSASVEGKKGVYLRAEEREDYVIDYVPLTLYPGKFHYDFDVNVACGAYHDEGVIEIPEGLSYLSCSDMVLGRKSFGKFSFHDIPLLPSLGGQFTAGGQCVSYLEVYGLVPDSLYYAVAYKITDHAGAVLVYDKKRILKHDYAQVDTHFMDLSKLVPGEYYCAVEIQDPSAASSIVCSSSLSIAASVVFKEPGFYRDIHYLLTPDEYQRFLGLSEIEKEIYMKDFWFHHDYPEFERRLSEADKRFSVGKLKGRDSERGKFYVRLGPPDEVETVDITYWSRPLEVWHYYGRNDYLFCDTKNDHNPRLIKVLKPGELTKLLETNVRDGTRDEEWMSEIAPGTHDWHKDKENPE